MTPGERLAVYVGEQPISSIGDSSGGWNGGGSGFLAGGGGGTDVRQGGEALGNRVVIGGGGGGGGLDHGLQAVPNVVVTGGVGGGLVGGNADALTTGGTQTQGGTSTNGSPGQLGLGGRGSSDGSGGGGGFYGGAGGRFALSTTYLLGAGAGGSGLGDSFESGACAGNGWVTLSYVGPPPGPHAILPSVVGVWNEGNDGSSVWHVPVFLPEASALPVSVDWETVDGMNGFGLATSGDDFVSASGTVTFAPGETVQYVPIEVLGDTADEAPLLWGEWGLVKFSNPQNATIDTVPFFGHGLFVIIDDD